MPPQKYYYEFRISASSDLRNSNLPTTVESAITKTHTETPKEKNTAILIRPGNNGTPGNFSSRIIPEQKNDDPTNGTQPFAKIFYITINSGDPIYLRDSFLRRLCTHLTSALPKITLEYREIDPHLEFWRMPEGWSWQKTPWVPFTLIPPTSSSMLPATSAAASAAFDLGARSSAPQRSLTPHPPIEQPPPFHPGTKTTTRKKPSTSLTATTETVRTALRQ